jgi:ubiquinone/menaquinone biosynthesis C-methylase UbiE
MRVRGNLLGSSKLTAFAVAVVCALVAGAVDACDTEAWEERWNRYQPPEMVMDSIGVRAGMVVAEVGAGKGRYVVHMAARVGGEGKVYANDIDEEKLEYLQARCEREGLDNVETILGEVENPLLPQGEIDLVYLINTYHDLDKPVELMRNIIPALKPGGVLVIIEQDTQKSSSKHHAIDQDELFDQAERAGYVLVRVMTFLERDNINIFRPAATPGTRPLDIPAESL